VAQSPVERWLTHPWNRGSPTVQYAMEGTRFRHTAQFRRWRADREPGGCTFAQLEEPVSYDLGSLLPGAPGTA